MKVTKYFPDLKETWPDFLLCLASLVLLAGMMLCFHQFIDMLSFQLEQTQIPDYYPSP